jgi:hypothetical protein
VTASELLARLDAVRSRGTGKWSARCPAHPDKTPSLTIQEGERGLLVKCWGGCTLDEITGKLGLETKDLFYDGLPDPRQRREAVQRRAKDRAAQRTADKARGRNSDLLRHAEYLIESARGMSIDEWSPDQLDTRLNLLGDAYDLLWEEQHDKR